jgi:EPS-associated MarR family transcriptional regulator
MALKLTDDVRYRIFRLIEEDPAISQRELAGKLGISLGKTNYCVKALIDKGILKANKFRNSRNKWAYIYVLTANGIKERARITMRFLKRKMAEHEALRAEIAEISEQARNLQAIKEDTL